MVDVAIIGAGVSGAAVARVLSAYDLRVVLLEKEADVCFGTSKANSGIVHGGFHHSGRYLKTQLEIRGNLMFDRLHRELDFPFERRGILVAAMHEDELKSLEYLYQQGVDNGAIGIEMCSRSRMLELEPKLHSDVVGGLYAPGGGIVEPYRYGFALVESACKNGVELMTGFEVVRADQVGDGSGLGNSAVGSEGSMSGADAVLGGGAGTGTSIGAGTGAEPGGDAGADAVLGVTPRDGTSGELRFTRLVARDGRKIEARWVVNAGGLYADEISRILGAEEFTITPRKGEYYLLDKLTAGAPRRVVFPVPSRISKGMLVIPTVEGTVLVGPTADDVEDKEDTATSGEKLDTIFDSARRLVPSIAVSDVITSFAGLRPAMEDGDFYIAVSERQPNLVQVAGIQSPGLTASPAIGEYVKELLKGAGCSMTEKRHFDPYLERIPHLRDKNSYEADRLGSDDPGYCRIVCRCETVSEAEIRAAIRVGHHTLDGVKFASRAGAGRCQGGFCTHRIIQLIQEETGIPYTRVSKHGPGSELFLGRIGPPAMPVPTQASPGQPGISQGSPESGQRQEQGPARKPEASPNTGAEPPKRATLDSTEEPGAGTAKSGTAKATSSEVTGETGGSHA
ncbi:NAD(P)/FAD-dependent oxidoreductase [Spirochaeta lutea]|uniref:NAD(P)/FAD-dependent oxidoreductase n=1 Tax=Spirochaeta lutea TaxID=1480694 RepID=UPI0009DE1B83|nr:NAD(P)/FAD-dependent oxidoreductase [Spirochaeta lutea]